MRDKLESNKCYYAGLFIRASGKAETIASTDKVVYDELISELEEAVPENESYAHFSLGCVPRCVIERAEFVIQMLIQRKAKMTTDQLRKILQHHVI